jgi:hypothetical protein
VRTGAYIPPFDSQRAQPVFGSQYMMRQRMSSVIGTKGCLEVDVLKQQRIIIILRVWW